MRATVLVILFVSYAFQTVFAQDESYYKNGFYTSFTLDELVWKDSLCFISRSPIRYLEGYKTLFSSIEDELLEIQFFPTFEDKKYSLLWIIADSTLFLSGVKYFPYIVDEKKKQQWIIRSRDTLEAFTYCRFVKKPLPVSPLYAEIVAKGVMEATWFTGSFYVMPEEIYWSKKENKHFYLMTFEKGKLVKQETIKPKKIK